MPSRRCADLLAEGAVEAALVPVIEYQRIDGIHLLRRFVLGQKKQFAVLSL